MFRLHADDRAERAARVVRYAVSGRGSGLRLRGLQRPLLAVADIQGHAPYAWTVLAQWLRRPTGSSWRPM